MTEIEQRVHEAVAELRLDVRKLPEADAARIVEAARIKYVEGNPRVWWLGLKEPYLLYDSSQTHLAAVLPATPERLFFIPEIDSGAAPLPVFEVRADELERLIGGCPYFEYYVLDAELLWLVIESDHDVFFVCNGSSGESDKAMFLEFVSDDGRAKVVIESDDRVAYAYLVVGSKVEGDVWLYNVEDTPEAVDWRDPAQMPFPNSREFVIEEPFEPVSDGSEVAVAWALSQSGELSATVILNGRAHAVLRRGAKPGWCRLAVKPGPLARPFDELASQ